VVRAATRRDYIPDVFTAWVRDGGFFGAELDGELVGFAKLTRMSRTEAFLEGLRVARRAREHGVGTALIRYRLDRALSAGMRVARYVTWSENDAMHRMARRLGFRRVAEDAWLRAPRTAGPDLRVADGRDAAALMALAQRSRRLLRVDHGHHSSRFRELTRQDVVDAIAERRCLVLDGPRGPAAFAILGPDRASSVYLASMTRRALGSFARGFRAYARSRPKTPVYLAARRADQAILARAGYRKSGRGYGVVFERALT
jgi:GNAT superfamily N-acetyltransferase